MNIATWSLRNPVPVILLFLLLTLAGLRSFQKLPVQDYPDIELPTVQIALAQPGAAPTQLEADVARKVEDSLATLAGLQHLRTSVSDGLVRIRVEFKLGKSLSDALIETKDAVDRIRADLPADLLSPTVSAVTTAVSPILTYAISSRRMDEEALSWFVDDRVNRALLAVPGVGRTERVGGVRREVRVEVDPARLASLGVTAAEVSRALQRNQQQSSGGSAEINQGRQSVRTVATLEQAGQLAALPLALADGRTLRLDQVAEVRDSHAERMQVALLDGTAVVGFQVFRARDVDQLGIAAGVARAIERLRAIDPDIEITLVSNRVDYTHEQYRGSMQMLWEGALLAVLVVWWFLRDWRATVVAATALPLSILPAFIGMAWLGYSLNTLTLLAVAVIVGILVDDAIVEIENIQRHRDAGKPIREATETAVTEIAVAVLATTLTLVVVFLPTAMLDGAAGLFFRQFGWTTVIAVLSSLLVARLLTPVMAAWLLKPGVHRVKSGGRMMAAYLRAVRWCLAHRKRTIGATLALFAASLALVPLIPTGLVPASDRGYTSIQVELPPGAALADSVAAAERVRQALHGMAGVSGVFAAVGMAPANAASSGLNDPRRATLTLMLDPRGHRDSQEQIERRVRAALGGLPGARFAVGAGGLGERLELIVASDNAQALNAAAQQLARQLRTVSGLSNIRSTASLDRPEVVIRPDAALAAERGIAAAAIGETVRIAAGGDFDADLSKLNLDNRQVAIRVRVAEGALSDLDAIGALRMPGRDGLVPLASVAQISLGSGPSQIDRYDRMRQVTITADLGGTPLGQAMKAALALPAVQALPAAVRLLPSGDAEWAGELAASFGWALLLALVCVCGVLVLLFKDLLQPLTILSAIPLSLGGAFAALLLVRAELDVPSMIGLVMLMGIVTKNSILLVEYAETAIQRGVPLTEALVDACRTRARPILMTTIAMIAGMLPIAAGFGADASFRQPMAVAVIGGLVTSTLLSLLVVPVVFALIDGAGRRLSRLAGLARWPS